MPAVGAGSYRSPPPVTLLDVVRPDGSRLLVAVSRSHAGTGYELTAGPDGRWQCACPHFAWFFDCTHVAAASAWIAREHTRGRTV